MAYLASARALQFARQLPLPQFNNDWFLSQTADGPRLLKNQCLHRGARLITEPTNNELIVCPLHRWTYAQDGSLQGVYFRGIADCKLPSQKIDEWNHLLFFDVPIGVQKMKEQLPGELYSKLLLDGYERTSTIIDRVNCDWRVFMEVYLDLYHVKPFHDGLGNFVDMNNVVWREGDFWSLQEVALTKKLGSNPSPTFKALEEKIRDSYPDEKVGALWFAIYPNIMIEVHPQTIVVSTVWPDKADPNKTINVVEFHHSEEVVAFDPDFVELQTKAYMETAAEDATIAERIQQGRGDRDPTNFPYHPELEAGIAHFYAHINRMSKVWLEPNNYW